MPNATQRILGAVIPGETAESVERKTEGATAGVVTGTPPPIAPGGVGSGTSVLRGLGAVVGGSALANEAASPGSPFDPVDSGRGVDLGEGGFEEPLGDLTDANPGDGPGDLIGKLLWGVFLIGTFLVVINAFASGVGEGVVS